MTQLLTRSVAGVVIASPMQYAAISVVRRFPENMPVYVALAIATALPEIALLFRLIIVAQGAELGGAQGATEFGAGAEIIAATTALVGIVQISLILGRTLSQRAPEYRLLVATIMQPAQIFRLTLWECAAHAMIGWVAGSALTGATILVGHMLGGFLAPAFDDVLATLAIGLPACLLAVIVPSLASHMRRTNSDSLVRREG